MSKEYVKPVVKVYLLPDEWSERDFQWCFNNLVEALAGISWLPIQDENDLIVLFPTDRMQKGLGTEIIIEVDLPEHLVGSQEKENEVVGALYLVMAGLLPSAYIQCKVYKFGVGRGFCSSNLPPTNRE